MDRRLFLVGAAGAAAAGGAFMYLRPDGAPQSELTAFGSANAQTNSDVDWSHISDMAIGSEDAPITVIEYASMTCPHCAAFHNEVFPAIKEEYVETGKVRFIMREVYFDRFGLWGTMIARCGGGMRYWGLQDVFFAQQSEWRQGETVQDVVNNMRAIGRQAGFNDAQLDECLQDQEMAEALVARFEHQMAEHDISGTPTFIINGQQYSNMRINEFRSVLNEKLAE